MTLFLVYVYLRWVSMKNCGHIYIYIRVEVKIVNEKSKSFLCVRERKSLEILNKMKQIVVLKH